ncbi:MAG: endonuclease III [Succinivibrio sp.]
MIFSTLNKAFLNPKSELNFKNPFELLCAVMLSAQATDASVNKVTPNLFKLAPTPSAMAALDVEKIAQVIKTIGLWRAKSENLKKMSVILKDQYQGKVPDSYDDLIRLPGVGSKTAKVVLNVAFNRPYVAVDTHIFRVCNRTGLFVADTVKSTEEHLPALIPQEYLLKSHHLLLLHGRYTCTARKPMCETCCISEWCKKNLS